MLIAALSRHANPTTSTLRGAMTTTNDYDVYLTWADAKSSLIEYPLIMGMLGSNIPVRGLTLFYDIDAIAEDCLYRANGGWTAHPEAVKRKAGVFKYAYTGKYTFLPVEGDPDGPLAGKELVEVRVQVAHPKIGATFDLTWGLVVINKDAPHSCKCVSGMLDGMEWDSDLDLLDYVKRLIMELSDN